MTLVRGKRWERASNKVILLKPEAAATVRMLGKIDATLDADDVTYRQWRLKLQDLGAAEWEQLHDSMALAHLWVLGAYELVRMLDEMFRGKADAASKRRRTDSLALKKQFERVRMPLAKLQPPERNPGHDYGVAYPALSAATGISWKVAENTVVSRNELSVALLRFLECLDSSEHAA